MKKFILSLIVMLTMAIGVNAQNYAGSSKFTDNWSVTLQGGTLTTMTDFYSGHTAVAPIVMIGADKYITPWLGVGVEARTLIGTGSHYDGSNKFQTHTAFDGVNVGGVVKFNLVNMFAFNGTRRMFEPVVYTGLGWGHRTCNDESYNNDVRKYLVARNYMTYRAGVEFNFNLGKERAWAIVVNPSVVWGDVNETSIPHLHASNGNFELTAGVVYHFKTSNGKRSFAKARLYDEAEVASLKGRIAELEARKPHVRVVEKVVTAPATDAVAAVESTYAVTFVQNSAELSDAAKAILDKVPANSTVDVAGSTSPEGTSARNEALAQERANAVAKYLESRGVKINKAVGGESGRVAVVTVK